MDPSEKKEGEHALVSMHSADVGVMNNPEGHSARQSGPPSDSAIDAEFEVLAGDPDDPDDSAAKTDRDEQHGPLVFINGDKLCLNLPAIAAEYARTKPAAYSAQKGQHYIFDEEEGLWKMVTRREACWSVSIFLKAEADRIQRPDLLAKRTPAVLSGIISLVEGHAPMGAPPPPSAKRIAVANGVLNLAGSKPVLEPFRKEDWFTCKSPCAYEPGAKCERFLNELLAPALPPADINLLQRDFGRTLVGGNDAQTISVLTGPGGSGKSVTVSVLELVLGMEKVAHLRTDKLNSRFETHALQDKTVGMGKDEKRNYLGSEGAALLKCLTGGDNIETEQKFGGKRQMLGNLFVFITSNGRMLIRLDGDASAWRRRLVVYVFDRKIPVRRVANFAEVLIREEGAGILDWLVEGYMAHQRELAEHGTLKLTEDQQRRVDDWIMESEGELAFARMHVTKRAGTVSVEELWQAYSTFAAERGWTLPSKQVFCTKLPEVMMELFGVERDNHIMRNGTAVRGFRGVVLNYQRESSDA